MASCSAMARPPSVRASQAPVASSPSAQVTISSRCISGLPPCLGANRLRSGKHAHESRAVSMSVSQPRSAAESAAAVFGGAFGQTVWEVRRAEPSSDPEQTPSPTSACEHAGTVTTSAGGLTSSAAASKRQETTAVAPVPLSNIATDLATKAELALRQQPPRPSTSRQPGEDSGEPVSEPFSLGWRTFDPDRYRTLNVLGSGGYGTVYLAEDSETGEQVAVKRIPKSRKRSPPEKVKRNLIKEASLLELMQFSPSVTRIMDKFEDERNAYLVMEYLQGGSLEEYVHRHRRDLTEADMAAIARNVFSFLSDCHAVDIVFADVKPANFMMTDTTPGLLSLKVIDFGCSQFKVEGEGLTMRTGTFKYFAPEVFRQNYGTPADNWSMGIMLYRIMSGSYPWWMPSRNLSPTEAMEDVCNEEPVPFDQSLWKRWSPAAQSFVKALLEKDPSKRLTADEALQHPWMLHYQAVQETRSTATASNILPLRLQPHSAPISTK